MVLHISAGTDINEESRAAALSFWEQLQAYALRNPAIRTSKRPIQVPGDAPPIVQEMVAAAGRAGVGPMYSFQGAVTDHVGRFLTRSTTEVTVSTGGGYFIAGKKRQKLTVFRGLDGGSLAVVVPPSRSGVGVATSASHGKIALDGIAVIATSCMLAEAASAGVQAILPKQGGLRSALMYLKKVPGVLGGMVLVGDRIGLAGGLEIAA
jgi:uncharacterized protein